MGPSAGKNSRYLPQRTLVNKFDSININPVVLLPKIFFFQILLNEFKCLRLHGGIWTQVPGLFHRITEAQTN